MSLFELTLGDYSNDGHGKSRAFYLEVSDGVTREDLAANYAKNVAEFGFDLKDIASEYEDSRIDGEQLLTLLKAGFVDEPNLEEDLDYPGRSLWMDDYIIEPKEDDDDARRKSKTLSQPLSWEEHIAVTAAEKQAGRSLTADEAEHIRAMVAERAAARVPLNLNGGFKPAKPWEPYVAEESEEENDDDEPKDPWEDFDEFDDYFLSPAAMFRIAVFFFTRGLPEGITFHPVQVPAQPLIGWHGVVDGFVGYGTFGY